MPSSSFGSSGDSHETGSGDSSPLCVRLRHGILDLVDLPSGGQGGQEVLLDHARSCDACRILLSRVGRLVGRLTSRRSWLVESAALPEGGNPLPECFEELPGFAGIFDGMLERGGLEPGTVEDLCREQLTVIQADPSLHSRVQTRVGRLVLPDSLPRRMEPGRQGQQARLRRIQKLTAAAAAAVLATVSFFNGSFFSGVDRSPLEGALPRIVVVDSDHPLGFSLNIQPTKLEDPLAGSPLLHGFPGSGFPGSGFPGSGTKGSGKR